MAPRRLETKAARAGRWGLLGKQSLTEALVPGPQGWGGGIMPWTHSPDQKSRSRSLSQERPYGDMGFGRKSCPGPPGSGTFLSRPFVCTESLSGEEPHLGGGAVDTGGQGKPVCPRSLCHSRITCPPLTEGAGLPIPSKDERRRHAFLGGAQQQKAPYSFPPKKEPGFQQKHERASMRRRL